MGKMKAKKGGIVKKAVSTAIGLTPVGNVAQKIMKGAGLVKGALGGGRARGGFSRGRKRSLASRVMRMRKQGIIEKEKARLMKIKLSAYK